LRKEWQEKVLRIEISITELEHKKGIRIDDLDAAFVQMTKLPVLSIRLGNKGRFFGSKPGLWLEVLCPSNSLNVFGLMPGIDTGGMT
jgi:hypothetical protein